MVLGTPVRPRESLGVIPMALALIVSAFLGAALGLVWQSSGLGEEEARGKSAGGATPGDQPGAEGGAQGDEEEQEDRLRPPVSG